MGTKKLRVAMAGAVVVTSTILSAGAASAKDSRDCYPPPQPMGKGYCKADLKGTSPILYAAMKYGNKHGDW